MTCAIESRQHKRLAFRGLANSPPSSQTNGVASAFWVWFSKANFTSDTAHLDGKDCMSQQIILRQKPGQSCRSFSRLFRALQMFLKLDEALQKKDNPPLVCRITFPCQCCLIQAQRHCCLTFPPPAKLTWRELPPWHAALQNITSADQQEDHVTNQKVETGV